MFASLVICLATFAISTCEPAETMASRQVIDSRPTKFQTDPELGKGIDLRESNLLESFRQYENTIYKSFNPTCYIDETERVRGSKMYKEYYENSNAFYSSLATQSELDASLQSFYTMGSSIKAATKHISSKEHTMSGLSLNAEAVSEKLDLARDCLIRKGTFAKWFLDDLKSLPTEVKEPWLTRSWRAYHHFVGMYGTHIINSVKRGSSFKLMTFAESSKSYTERDFEVQACLSLEGATFAGEAKFKACTKITKEERSKASRIATTEKVFVLGGRPETRNKLVQLNSERSMKEIQDLLNQAKTSPSTIQHTFYAMWTMLQERFPEGSDNNRRGRNLEYYYLGFLNYGCRYQEKKGVVFQRFEPSPRHTKSYPDFQCSIAKEGCQDDKGCQRKGDLFCICGGNSCVRHKSETQDNGSQKQTAYPYNKSDWLFGGNCDPGRCTCNNNVNQRDVVWVKKNNDAPTHKARHHGSRHKAKDPGHLKPLNGAAEENLKSSA